MIASLFPQCSKKPFAMWNVGGLDFFSNSAFTIVKVCNLPIHYQTN